MALARDKAALMSTGSDGAQLQAVVKDASASIWLRPHSDLRVVIDDGSGVRRARIGLRRAFLIENSATAPANQGSRSSPPLGTERIFT